jgi:hypothetical protein
MVSEGLTHEDRSAEWADPAAFLIKMGGRLQKPAGPRHPFLDGGVVTNRNYGNRAVRYFFNTANGAFHSDPEGT